jgi:hypothetical protein
MDKFTEQIIKSYSDKLNSDILSEYKKFVGEPELQNLLKKFNNRRFTLFKKWNQVMGSFSTSFLGSGFGSSSITAEYSKLDNNTVNVLNRAINDSFQDIFVKGISEPRQNDIPTCRTVSFGINNVLKGDYWILYINDSLDTFIVVAPLFIPGTSIKIVPVLACYVLTSKTHCKFWGDDINVKEILNISKKYGFDNIFNKPLATADSLDQGEIDEAINVLR